MPNMWCYAIVIARTCKSKLKNQQRRFIIHLSKAQESRLPSKRTKRLAGGTYGNCLRVFWLSATRPYEWLYKVCADVCRMRVRGPESRQHAVNWR